MLVCRKIPSLSFLFLAAAWVFLAACGGNSSNISSITISPTTASVPLNTQATFTAVVNLNNTTTATNTAVTWEVNGSAGGNATVGTIVSSGTNAQDGIYTAPAVVPSTNNGQVMITAVSTTSATTTTVTSGTANVITSNTATVTVTGGVGLAVSPTTATVPAGGSFQFSATVNSIADTNATWSVTPVSGVNVGSITPNTGIYTAPLYPPPGGMVAISASDGTTSISVTATVTYSDKTLSGPYAFFYKGNDLSGFRAAAGSFVADGNGNITSGVEDIESFLTGVSTEVPITGTYVVGPDGRTTAIVNPAQQTSATLQFALITNLQGLLIRFNGNNSGSGTIDQQNVGALSNAPSEVSGPYVFRLSGVDAGFAPLAMAGKFSSSGNGTIPQVDTILDVNDNGAAATNTTLSGSYVFDPAFPGTGRGTFTLTSTATGSRQFAFYAVDGTRVRLVETDRAAYTAGDAFASPTGSSFTNNSLAAGSYVFTAGGMSAGSAFAAGGVFTDDSNGNISAGVIDTNAGGTAKLNATLGASTYSVDPATGRISLSLVATGTNASTHQFAIYPASSGSAVMLETDANAVATGIAIPQQSATASFSGNFALNLAGQGLFHNAASSYQQDVEGQATLDGSGASAGNLDIDNFTSVFPTDPIGTTSTTIATTATSTGRGTAVLAANGPAATYNLIYYSIGANSALLFDSDTSHVLIGVLDNQY